MKTKLTKYIISLILFLTSLLYAYSFKLGEKKGDSFRCRPNCPVKDST